MLNIGDTVERYLVEGVVGQGGVATVFKVRHTELGTFHALKLLNAGSTATRDRLLKEGRAQASLMHTNVVRVSDILRVGDNPGLVMEYVDGPSLREFMASDPPDIEKALRLFRGIVRGVAAAHHQGIIHRDLKPANVLLAITHEGVVPKVADFGLLKSFSGNTGTASTGAGVTMGTPQYMAPEQVRDAAHVDLRADLFSLGVILYELVCGERPFKGKAMIDVMNNIVVGNYTPPERLVPGLPPPVTNAIETLLQADPDKRYIDCDDLLEVLYAERTPAFGTQSETTGESTISRLTPNTLEDPRAIVGGLAHLGWEIGAGTLMVTAGVMAMVLMTLR